MYFMVLILYCYKNKTGIFLYKDIPVSIIIYLFDYQLLITIFLSISYLGLLFQ